ncbi:hypothetical protein SEA_SUCCESS_82 [Streptomyces phage Success]|uniref:Uncharacterized protein n=1 Tax=Streptomyces phage Success TaxID=2999013 RepID=A0A9E8M7C0_9CAUD|nr:hypothetical protein QEH47_gp50 [Streptomyces phage Success]WAB08861.1 hypothetical protein SEA_SUCCESS_82 [Streptomyces phage Success]
MIPMTCGGCEGEVLVTPEQWHNWNTVPCPHCPDGGVDLIHARRHADAPSI